MFGPCQSDGICQPVTTGSRALTLRPAPLLTDLAFPIRYLGWECTAYAARHRDCPIKRGMLRVTVQHGEAGITLKLEGNVAGAWVSELEEAWRVAHSARAGRHLRLDLTGVQHVDRSGEYLLALVRYNGGQLIASGPAMGELVRSIEQAWPVEA